MITSASCTDVFFLLCVAFQWWRMSTLNLEGKDAGTTPQISLIRQVSHSSAAQGGPRLATITPPAERRGCARS